MLPSGAHPLCVTVLSGVLSYLGVRHLALHRFCPVIILRVSIIVDTLKTPYELDPLSTYVRLLPRMYLYYNECDPSPEEYSIY